MSESKLVEVSYVIFKTVFTFMLLPKTSIFKDWKLAGSANLAKADFLGFLFQIKTVTQ